MSCYNYHINTERFIIVIKLRMSTSTRNSAVADKPRDAFVQMQWRGWPNQRYQDIRLKKIDSSHPAFQRHSRSDTDRSDIYDFLLVFIATLSLRHIGF